MKRERRSVWEKRVADWRRSGLGATAFAATIGVKPSALSYWRWKLNLEQRPAPAPSATAAPATAAESQHPHTATVTHLTQSEFVELHGVAMPAAPAPPIEVTLTRGLTLRVPPHFDADTLARLLDVLEQR